MNQMNTRTLPVEIRNKEIAKEVLLQQVARMEANPAEMEYKATLLAASTPRSL